MPQGKLRRAGYAHLALASPALQLAHVCNWGHPTASSARPGLPPPQHPGPSPHLPQALTACSPLPPRLLLAAAPGPWLLPPVAAAAAPLPQLRLPALLLQLWWWAHPAAQPKELPQRGAPPP